MSRPARDEQLRASLLYRLTDDDPEVDVGRRAADRMFWTDSEYRREIKEELEALFNTCSLRYAQDLTPCPLAERSVLAFGFRDLAGVTASGLGVKEVEKMVRKAIEDHEPRILPGSKLAVRAYVSKEHQDKTTLVVEIEGQLCVEPQPEYLFITTTVDLDDGSFKVLDDERRS